MAITVQSVFNLPDTVTSTVAGSVATPTQPFAMLFASQLQQAAPALATDLAAATPLPADTPLQDFFAALRQPVKSGQVPVATTTAADALQAMLDKLVADREALPLGGDSALLPAKTADAHADLPVLPRARGEKTAALPDGQGWSGTEQAALLAQIAARMQDARTTPQNAPAVASALPAAVSRAANLVVDSQAVVPAAAEPALTADSMLVSLARAAGVPAPAATVTSADETPSGLPHEPGAIPLPMLMTAGKDKPASLAAGGEGLSAAVAARMSLREEALQHPEEGQALPASSAAVRQELPHMAPSAPAPRTLEASIGGTMDRSRQWGEAFSNQVMKAVERQMDSARFHVSPEKLGPIDITITMNKDQAQVTMTAANPQARDIIQSHLPALSRMMDQAGVQLADAQVSTQQQGQFSQSQQQAQQQSRQRGGRSAEPFDLNVLAASPVPDAESLSARLSAGGVNIAV